MSTRGILAVGLVGCAVAAAAPASAQDNPNQPPPGRGPSVNLSLGEPPPADRPLIRALPQPTLTVDGGAGVLGYVGGTGRLGPSWNVRVTGIFTPRFALEGNYVGATNQRSDNTGSLLYTSLDASVRYNILRADEAPLQPYVAAGLGWGAWFGPNGTPASVVIPVAVGAERLLTEHIKVGARLDLRPAFFDNLGRSGDANAPGGDTWSLRANVGGAF